MVPGGAEVPAVQPRTPERRARHPVPLSITCAGRVCWQRDVRRHPPPLPPRPPRLARPPSQNAAPFPLFCPAPPTPRRHHAKATWPNRSAGNGLSRNPTCVASDTNTHPRRDDDADRSAGASQPLRGDLESARCRTAPQGDPEPVVRRCGPKIIQKEIVMFSPKAAFSGFSVNDLGQAKEFYAETLGLTVTDGVGGARIQLPGGSQAWM